MIQMQTHGCNFLTGADNPVFVPRTSQFQLDFLTNVWLAATTTGPDVEGLHKKVDMLISVAFSYYCALASKWDFSPEFSLSGGLKTNLQTVHRVKFMLFFFFDSQQILSLKTPDDLINYDLQL